MKLLLAEDDVILADALGVSLRKAGFEVEVADNGAVAEYLLLRHNFDIGVLDLGLPLVDELTVSKRLRSARVAAVRPRPNAARQGRHQRPDRRDVGGRAQRIQSGLDRGLHPSPAPQARKLRPRHPHRACTRVPARSGSEPVRATPADAPPA